MENQYEFTDSLIDSAEKMMMEIGRISSRECDELIRKIELAIQSNRQTQNIDNYLKLLHISCTLNYSQWRKTQNMRYLDLAINNLDSIIEVDCRYYDVLYDRGVGYFEKGMALKNTVWFDKAISDLSMAINIDNSNIDAYYQLGEAYHQKCEFMSKNESNLKQYIKQLDWAIENYSHYLQVNKHNMVFKRRGDAYYKKYMLLMNDEELVNKALEDYKNCAGYAETAGRGFLLQRGFLFWEKGRKEKNIDCIESSIADLSKFIQSDTSYEDVNTIISLVNLGAAYGCSGWLGNDRKKMEHSIDILTKAIDIMKAKTEDLNNLALSYRQRGHSYLLLGDFTNDNSYYNLAIQDQTKAISLNEKNGDFYNERGLSLQRLGRMTEAKLDMNTLLYLFVSKQTPYLNPLFCIEIEKEELFNLNSLLAYVLQEGGETNYLLNSFFKVREQLRDFLLILKFTEFNFNKSQINSNSINNWNPLLLYYLKGCVTSYRIYNKMNDSSAYKLSAQDYYYYVKSARQFSKDAITLIGAKSVLQNAIEKYKNNVGLTDIDYYYLGLLYCIQIEDEDDERTKTVFKNKAMDCFNASGSIWSKRMLDILSNNVSNQDEFNNYILKNCNEKRDIVVDYLVRDNIIEADFMKQFEDYIHFQEVESAYHELYNNVDDKEETTNRLFTNRVVFHEHLWEVFELSERSIQELISKVSKVSALEIFKKVVENWEIKQLTKEEEQTIEEDYFSFLNINDSIIAEKKIVDEMRNGINSDDFNLIIRFLYHKGTLEKKQYVTLSMYYGCYYDDKKEKEQKKHLAVIDTIIHEIMNMVIVNPVVIVFNSFITILKSIYFDEIQEGNIRYIKYSDYKTFSSNVWRSMNNDYHVNTDYEFVNLLV